MNTIEEIMEAIRKLPATGRRRPLSTFREEILPEEAVDAAPAEKGALLLSVAGLLNAGEVLNPQMDRESIYPDLQG